ncbi:unnamed protein product [Urochloa humidicola]
MECNKDEAARAKALAERKMLDNDFVGAKKVITKAQLSKEVDDIDIPKMLSVCDVHCAAGAKVNAEVDWYGILQVPVTADDALIKKQYHKLAILLHPDKNKFGGAEAAFKLVGEANITLTDRSKRFEYDMKRNPSRGGAERPPYQQPRTQAPARSRATPGSLHKHQRQKHQAPNPVGTQTFWTICPSCDTRYQYYISILKKALRCQNCLKPFIARELKEQAVPSGVWTNAGALKKFPSPQTNVTGQKAWFATRGVHVNSGSHHADVDTKRETDGKTAAFKDKIKSDRATGNASKVSSTTGLKKRRRAVIESSESSISETSSDSEEEILKHGLKKRRRAVIESSESSISETSSDSEEEILKHGPAANSAGPGQQTHRSSKQNQGVKYNEESDHDDDVGEDNNKVDYDFANSPGLKRLRKSGMFHGDHSNQTTNLNKDIGSHNGLTNGVNNCSNKEDKNKGGAPCGEKTFDGIDRRERERIYGGENSKKKLVHSVSTKFDVPKGSLEIDPAALPSDLEEAFPSVIPECSSVGSQKPNAKCAGSPHGNSSHKEPVNFSAGQHSTCMNEMSAAITAQEMNSKHNTITAEVNDADDGNVWIEEYVYDLSEFYDFSEIRSLQKFSPEQIWALYSAVDKFPNYYGLIQKVDLKNAEVQVRWLDVFPRGEEEIRLLQEERPFGCGTFRLSSTNELMTYTTTDAFSHPVEARYTGNRGEYEIIPNLGEIWAVFKNWKAGWTAEDFEKCEYELVEILGHTDSSIQAQVLRKVDGNGAVFMPCRAEGSLKTIRTDEFPKFSHRIPCFHLTHENGGKHQGHLELDPLSLPKEFLNEVATNAVNLEPSCGEAFGTKVM